MIPGLEQRVAKRKAELESRTPAERHIADSADIIFLVIQYLFAFGAAFAFSIGYPEYATPLILAAIYLHLKDVS